MEKSFITFGSAEYIRLTPDRRQSETLILSTNEDQNLLETEFQLSFVA